MAERYLFLVGKADHPDKIPNGGGDLSTQCLSAKCNLAVDFGYTLLSAGPTNFVEPNNNAIYSLYAVMIKDDGI